VNIIVHTGGWDWGWDSLVAIGTFTLAFATGFLAWKTKSLADQTAQEVASQTRPVLVPAQWEWADTGFTPAPVSESHRDMPLVFNTESGNLNVRIRNAGGGPALDVQARLEPWDITPQPWHKAAFSPDAIERLRFTGVSAPEGTMTLSLRYRDLAERMFESRIVIERVRVKGDPPRDAYRFADVSFP
jgi:hypothetical protein